MKKLSDMLPSLTADAEREKDRVEMLERSERRAWLVSKGAGAIAALSMGAVAAQPALRKEVYIPIVVDKTTGEATVVHGLSEGTVPLVDAMDKHFASRFVMARYGYVPQFLKRDYDMVARMATASVFAPYNDLFYPKTGEGLQRRLGDRQLHRITVGTKRLTGSNADGTRSVVVTYDKEVLYLDRSAPSITTRHVATLLYLYEPKAMKTELDRDENPFGWICTACRSDQVAFEGGAS